MIIHSLDIEEVYKTLLSSPEGLTQQEAARRMSEYGPNEIRAARKKPLYLRFVAQFTHFLAVLLWIAAALCALSELIRPGEGMLLLAAAIVGVIFVNAVFTFVQEYRAEKAVEALKRLLPFKVKAVRGGSVVEVRSEDGTMLARGQDLLRTTKENVPMTRLTRLGEKITRLDLWIDDSAYGKPVMLAGGDVGLVTSWWHAPDHSEWRWTIELYKRGIKGEDMDFNDKEKHAATHQTFNIQKQNWNHLQSLGANFYAIAMDEPFLCCRQHIHKPDDYAVRETADFIARVREHFPRMLVGDIETYATALSETLRGTAAAAITGL